MTVALALSLAACDVDFEEATALAYKLVERDDLYSRPLALLGVWGPIIREWLETLLPDDSAEICRYILFVHHAQDNSQHQQL